jgi:plastocyanin
MHAPLRLAAVVGLLAGTSVVALAPRAAAGGGCHRIFDDRGIEDRAGDTVEMAGLCMSPQVLRVEPGTTVSFVNRDPTEHDALGVGVRVDRLAFGGRRDVAFPDVGVFPYHCTLHAGMVGAVVVEAVEDAGRTEASAASPPVAAGGLAVLGLGAGAGAVARRRRRLRREATT